MKYIVISSFKDLTDNSFEYKVGDFFPREGRTVEEISKERLDQLETANNNKKRILIKKIEVNKPEAPKAEEPEAPKAEEPEAPKAEEPEAPKAEEPEAPKAEEPKKSKSKN